MICKQKEFDKSNSFFTEKTRNLKKKFCLLTFLKKLEYFLLNVFNEKHEKFLSCCKF